MPITEPLTHPEAVNANLPPVVIIDNYDSFSYNLYQMVQMQTNRPVEVYRNDQLTLDALMEKKPDRVILSPGPGHPGIEKDFGICKEIVLAHEKLGCPILGVCLGHQGMAHHLGGKVVSAPEIVHGKTSMVRIIGASPLLDGLPSPFEAMRYHSLLVDENTLPACLRITAREETLGLPMAFQHVEAPMYGIQFHPESIGTPDGKQLLRNFLEQC